jgi:DNA-binding MarR family transcriptional regulator
MIKPSNGQPDVGGPPASELADLADLILNVSQEIKMLSSNGEGITLTLTESNVMRFVDRHPGTSPSALARGTGLHRSNMSAALRGLEEKGLINRAHHGDDGRAITVEPTDIAAQNLERLRKSWTSGLVHVLNGETEGFREALEFLQRLETGLIRSRQDQSRY